MIKSCEDCKQKCCKIGPGPHTPIPLKEWLDHAGQGGHCYNTVCEHFDLKEKMCGIWMTPEFPLACRQYVCHSREFSEEELMSMAKLHQVDCLRCGRDYMEWDGRSYSCPSECTYGGTE